MLQKLLFSNKQKLCKTVCNFFAILTVTLNKHVMSKKKSWYIKQKTCLKSLENKKKAKRELILLKHGEKVQNIKRQKILKESQKNWSQLQRQKSELIRFCLFTRETSRFWKNIWSKTSWLVRSEYMYYIFFTSELWLYYLQLPW